MVMLVGYSLAGFQADAFFTGRFARVLRSLVPVLVPFYLIVAGYSIAWQEIPWASVFLVGNFGLADPERHTMLPLQYWFVEAYVQMLLLWIGLFLIPPVRRFARRDPFGFGLAFLAAAMAFRFVGPALWPIDWRRIFTLPWNLYLAIFGWCVVFADSLKRKLTLIVLGLLVMPLMAYFGGNWTSSWVKFLLQIPVLSALLFLPRVRLPQRAASVILPFSVASYHIYLFHGFSPDLLRLFLETELPEAVITTTVIISGVALGFIAHAMQKKLVRGLAKARDFVAAFAVRPGPGKIQTIVKAE